MIGTMCWEWDVELNYPKGKKNGQKMKPSNRTFSRMATP